MTGWLLMVAVIVADIHGEPRILDAYARIVDDEAECVALAKKSHEKLDQIGAVTTSCDPLSSMPITKRRGTRT